MEYEFIHEKSFDTPAKVYAKYLYDTKKTAEETLLKPVQNWPKGTSHEISRIVITEVESAAFDLNLNYGTFDANGKVNGYVDN